MTVLMKDNWIFAQPGQKVLRVASNFTNYLQLGTLGVTAYYLEAEATSNEFLLNGHLLRPDGTPLVHIANNLPEDDGVSREMTPHGYRFIDRHGEFLFGMEVEGDNVCVLRGKIYDEKGDVVAEDSGSDFLVYRGPAVIGKSDGAYGIVFS